MKEKFKKLILRTTQSLVLILTLVWVFAPVVAGMLFMMAAWMVPIAFTSYWLFGIFGQNKWLGNLIELKYIGNTPGVRTLLVFELLLIAVGLVLFTWGFIHIVLVKLNKEGLATGGPYKYIRHPQHLGLILITFSFSLYVPETEDLGILVAEILSWSLFTLVLFLWSDHEERQLAKKFGGEFVEYRSRTGAFFPRIFNKNKKKKSFYEIKYWKRYSLTIFLYFGFILFMYILSLPVFGIFSPLY